MAGVTSFCTRPPNTTRQSNPLVTWHSDRIIDCAIPSLILILMDLGGLQDSNLSLPGKRRKLEKQDSEAKGALTAKTASAHEAARKELGMHANDHAQLGFPLYFVVPDQRVNCTRIKCPCASCHFVLLAACCSGTNCANQVYREGCKGSWSCLEGRHQPRTGTGAGHCLAEG